MTNLRVLKACKYKPSQVMQTFYKMLYIVSCLDFGYFEHKSSNARLFWKLITALRSVTIIALMLFLMDYCGNIPWFTLDFGNYFLNVIFLTSISSNKTFCQLHRDFQIIDIKLRKSGDSYKLEKKLLLCAIFDIILKFIIYTLFCARQNDCMRPIMVRYIYFWIMVTLNTVQLSCGFAFYSITCRLKRFSTILQTEDRDNLSMQFIYKSIVDLAEMQKTASSPMLLLSIIFTTVVVMTYILMAVKEIRMGRSIAPQIDLLIVASNLATIFGPALSAEVLATQKEKIVLILHDKIMQEREPSRQRELKRFTRYVEARTLRFRLYRVIPLDAHLLSVVLNFAVTYLIVIIQFTYK